MKKLYIILCVLLPFTGYSQNGKISTRDSLKIYTCGLVNKALKKKKFRKIVFCDFTDSRKEQSDIGSKIADLASIYATDNDSIIVIDRQNLNSFINEHKLKEKDFLIDKNDLLEMGKISGAEVLALGKVSILERECALQVYVKIIDANTAQTLSAADEYIPVDARFADGSNLYLNCLITDINKYGLPGKDFGRPSASNEIYNNSQPLKENGCEQTNTGIYCFANQTTQNFIVTVFKTPLGPGVYPEHIFSGAKEEIILKPHESKCIYSLPPGSYQFIVSFDQYSLSQKVPIYDQASFNLEKCASKTYLIRSVLSTETRKEVKTLGNKVIQKAVSIGANIIKEALGIKNQ